MDVFVNNTNMLELLRLKSAVENTYINDAAVNVTVKTTAGANVSGQTWPLLLTYVPGSSGDYRGVLSENLAFAANTTYVAVVHANAGINRVGHWEVPFVPRVRIK